MSTEVEENEEFVDGLRISVIGHEAGSKPGSYKYVIQLECKYKSWKGTRGFSATRPINSQKKLLRVLCTVPHTARVLFHFCLLVPIFNSHQQEVLIYSRFTWNWSWNWNRGQPSQIYFYSNRFGQVAPLASVSSWHLKCWRIPRFPQPETFRRSWAPYLQTCVVYFLRYP